MMGYIAFGLGVMVGAAFVLLVLELRRKR